MITLPLGLLLAAFSCWYACQGPSGDRPLEERAPSQVEWPAGIKRTPGNTIGPEGSAGKPDGSPPATPERDRSLPDDHAGLLVEMVATAKRVVADFPENPWAYDFQGRVYSYLGKSTEAAAAWRRCLELDEQRPDACFGLAELAIRAQNDTRAEELLRRALEIDPQLPKAANRLADLLFRDGRLEQAQAVLRSYLRRVPRSAESLIQLGQIQLQLGTIEEAEANFKTAIDLLPTSSEAHFGLGTALVRQGERQAARKYLEKSRELKSRQMTPREGVTAGAMDLVMTRANCAGAYTYAARLYVQDGNVREAERLCRRAAKMDERNVACRLLLMEIYRREGRQLEAIPVCEELRAADPGNPEWIWRWGLLHAQLGRFDAAESAFREVIRAEPQRARGYVSLADVLRRSRRGAREALLLAQKAVQLEPAARHFALLGEIHVQLGNPNKALEAITKSLRQDPDNPRYRRLHEQLQAAR